MAPRSAKAKKTADVKVIENEAPKKGRGKTKTIEEPELELPEPEINEKVVAPVSDKKKRGKKAATETNGQDETNGAAEDTAPPAKKGRKKNNEDVSDEKIDDKSQDESPRAEETQENGDDIESEPQTVAKGRKKQTKKETTQEKPKEGSKGKKNAKQVKAEVDVVEKEEENEEKPKSTGKGRGRKGKNDKEGEQEEKTEDVNEEVKQEPPTSKGRKKGGKIAKESAADGDKEVEDFDEKPVEEIKKNDVKGKKNQTKKGAARDEVEPEEEKDDMKNAKKRKTAKKEKAKGDSKEDEPMEEDNVESKGKGKRAQKKTVEPVDNDEINEGESTTKRRRKPAEEKDATKKPPPKNKAATDYETIDFTNNSKNAKGKDWNFKISSWNVDGIRAWLGKGGMDYIKYEKPNILCLQEIKCSKEKLPNEIVNLPGYHTYWLSGDIDGYAGVGIFTTKLAMNVQYGLGNPELDSEGRIITAEYEPFYLICTYVPNAGRKLVTLPKRLQWNEEFRKYVKDLDKKKPVIICGDMNVAHNEIDLKNPKGNRKNAGFTEEERQGMSELLADGFVDAYRRLYPDAAGAYTFWTYMMNSRAKNVGWRLDYFIVSERLLPCLCDSVIRDQVYGSDHCPITLLLHLTSAEKPKE